jgi:hypothetical protein
MSWRGCVRVVGAGLMVGAMLQTAAIAAPAARSTGARTTGARGDAPPAKATLKQLAWIAGPWGGTSGDRHVEQHWMAPAGHSMLGMFRYVLQDHTELYELLAIEEDAGSIVLRIKHFVPGAGLTGKQAVDESLNHSLIRVEGRTAVFEEDFGDSRGRITFSSPSPNTLMVRVERISNGVPSSTEFKYTRITH